MEKKFRKPYRIKKKKSIFKSKFFWIPILVLIIFGGIFYLICFFSLFQLNVIKISGNEKVKIKDLEGVIQNQIIRDLKFFKTKSIFLVDLDKINKALLENFSQIVKVNLKREFPAAIFVHIEERKPVAIFCQDTNCFLLDKDGIIFENAQVEPVQIEENQLLKIQNLNTDKELRLGGRVLEKELLLSILEIESKLKDNLKISIEEVSAVSDERLNVKTSEGWEIYFNPKKDLNWQLTKLKAVLEKYIPLEKRVDLEYIELRFGDLAPYKYR